MEVGQHGICNAPAQLKARFLIVADASTRTETVFLRTALM
jgi:hypothetical protein